MIDMARGVTLDNIESALSVVNADHGVTHVNRRRCRFTERRIQTVQNETFALNAQPDRMLTDVQLCFVWCACFPMADGMVFAPNRPGTVPVLTAVKIVNGARRSYNAGDHGNPVAPSVPSVRFGSVPRNVADDQLAGRVPTPTPTPATSKTPRLRKR